MSYLGLDVGGTLCRFEWADDQHAGGDAPSALPTVHGIDATVDALVNALRAAGRVALPSAVVCAIAGAADASIRSALATGLRARGIGYPVAIVGDVLAAAAAGLRDGPGVLLWSGTGSFVVVRGADGELVRGGGRGWQFGDGGSGYDLVRRAVRAALHSYDGVGPSTVLVELLTEVFAAPTPDRLGAVAQQLPPREIAAKLPVLLQAVGTNDEVALQVVADGVAALIDLAAATAQRVGLDWSGAPAIMGGGVLSSGNAVRALLEERLRDQIGATPVRALSPRAAAAAAAWLAKGWHLGLGPCPAWPSMSRSDLFLRDGRVLPSECFHLSFARSGGAGGQHVNKTETKVVLRLDLDAATAVLGAIDVARIRTRLAKRLDADGRLVVTASEHKSQWQNYRAAMERMTDLLAAALVRQKRRIRTKPTRSSQRRRLDDKKRRGAVKRDRQRRPDTD